MAHSPPTNIDQQLSSSPPSWGFQDQEADRGRGLYLKRQAADVVIGGSLQAWLQIRPKDARHRQLNSVEVVVEAFDRRRWLMGETAAGHRARVFR